MATKIKQSIVDTKERLLPKRVILPEAVPSDPIDRAKNNLVAEGEHETRENSRQWHGVRYPFAHPVRIATTFRHEFTAIAWALVALVERMDKLVDLLSQSELVSQSERRENGNAAPPLEEDH